jgi:hypothetical protein
MIDRVCAAATQQLQSPVYAQLSTKNGELLGAQPRLRHVNRLASA